MMNFAHLVVWKEQYIDVQTFDNLPGCCRVHWKIHNAMHLTTTNTQTQSVSIKHQVKKSKVYVEDVLVDGQRSALLIRWENSQRNML